MSTKKISALTALSTTPAAGDLLPIVDISDTTDAASGTTKSIVPAKLFQAAGIGAGAGTEPVNIDTSTGLVGIGLSGAFTPSAQLHLKTDANTGVADSFLQIENTNSSDDDYAGIGFQQHNAGGIKAWFGTRRNGASYGHQDFVFIQDPDSDNNDVALASGNEVMVIDKNGKVGIGATAPALPLHVSDSLMSCVMERWPGASTAGPGLQFRKSRGSSDGSFTVVAEDDPLGSIHFYGADGDSWVQGAAIYGNVDGTPGDGDMPGRLVFYTTPDGASAAVERMRIDRDGNVMIGDKDRFATATSSAGNLHMFNATAPAASVANGVVLYAQDTTSSSELKVRDEAGNISTLSPHNFDLLGERSEPMAWSYTAKNAFVGKEIAVDMTKVIRALEKLTGEEYIKIRDIADSEKLDWATEQKKYEAQQKKEIDGYKARKAESDAHPTNSSTKAEIKTFLDEKGISYTDAPKDELFEKVPEKEEFTETEPAAYSKKSKPSWID